MTPFAHKHLTIGIEMIVAPPAFDGRFSEFFDKYVLPNTPSVARVREFDLRLRAYLDEADPIHPTRMVRGQERGVVCDTKSGARILPTDNSPVWWVHAFLLSDQPFPKNNEELFAGLPFHMFKLPKGMSYLRDAGFHAAHLIDAKNGDTAWRAWSKDEVKRRALVNIHPCNMVLVAKVDWRFWGGRPDVISWAKNSYKERYGSLLKTFLSDVGALDTDVPSPEDFRYQYPQQSEIRSQMPKPPTRKRQRKDYDPSGLTKQGAHLALNRPLIKKTLLGREIWLDISVGDARYLVPHDDLHDWVAARTNALNTQSWIKGGLYSWPKPSSDMASFLKKYVK